MSLLETFMEMSKFRWNIKMTSQFLIAQQTDFTSKFITCKCVTFKGAKGTTEKWRSREKAVHIICEKKWDELDRKHCQYNNAHLASYTSVKFLLMCILDNSAVAEPCWRALQTTEGYIPCTTYIMKLRLPTAKTIKQRLPWKQTGKWPLSLKPQ